MIHGGDFNVAHIDWNLIVPERGSNMQGLTDSLPPTLVEHDLINTQYEPSKGENVLDLFCTNKPSLVKSVTTISDFSDHSFIVVDTVLKPVSSKK